MQDNTYKISTTVSSTAAKISKKWRLFRGALTLSLESVLASGGSILLKLAPVSLAQIIAKINWSDSIPAHIPVCLFSFNRPVLVLEKF